MERNLMFATRTCEVALPSECDGQLFFNHIYKLREG